MKPLLSVAGEKASRAVMTAGEQLIERGRQQGLQQGLHAGQRGTLLRQLRKRFGALPSELDARVQAAGPEQIEDWLDRVVTAPTLAEVLA